MPRHVTATINLDALAHNFKRVKALAPNAKVLGMVKANAYGHGAPVVAKRLEAEGCDALGVAHLSEAKALRASGLHTPIVALSGPLNAFELQQHIILNIDIVIHQIWQLELLERKPLMRPMRVWLKINTGMNRLGLSPTDAKECLTRLRALANISEIIVMTHCATADDVDTTFFDAQLTTFDAFSHTISDVGDTNTHFSFANSAGIIHKSPQLLDWVRPGIMLYGSSPFTNTPERTAQALALAPVMTLQAEVIALNLVARGETVGYGRRWHAERDSVIAVVGIGYGDGYPRHARDGTPALINGHRAPLAGRVSMDLSCFDVTDCADAIAIGDNVELWGHTIAIDEVAQYADTISYELMCRLTSRVTFSVK